ncbi:MAG: helix-turn-helix transcriptional regulator [Clostridia bacterium]|nr:helix-turn-helix transcriptional regulator [Clostridia bacterium]
MNIGEKIRNAREDMDLSQNDMAKLIPMNQSNYSKIERSVQEPSLEQLKRICQILKLDPRYLLNLEQYEFLSSEDMQLLKDVKVLIKKHTIKTDR